MQNRLLNSNFIFCCVLSIFFLVTLSPILALYIKTLPSGYVLSLYNGSLDSPNRLPQYMPILAEFLENKFFFQNSVDQNLSPINIENIRTIPFLISILPGLFSENLNFIILSNYFLSITLQLIIIFLITKFFLKEKNITILIISICIFFNFGYFTFNPLDVFHNIFLSFDYNISYSDISNDFEIIFR